MSDKNKTVVPTAEKKDLSFIKENLSQVGKLKNEFTDEQFNFMRGLVNPDLKDTELLMFLSFSNKLQLNPFTGEIIAIAYNGQHGRTVNTIITRNGKRVVATRTGELDGIDSEAIYVKKVVKEVPTHKYNDESGEMEQSGVETLERVERVQAWEGGTLWGATAVVTRKGKEFSVTVPLKEYNTGKNVWAQKPETMIKKVAESQALSAAFPEILGSVYDDAEAESITYKTIDTQETADNSPATDSQLATIKSMGGEPTANMTFDEAATMIGELSAPKKKGDK